MKKLHIVAMFLIGFIPGIVNSLDLSQDYSNQLNTIHQFGNKIVCSFEYENPICTYTPASFEEAGSDSQLHRYFMPYTKTKEDLSTSLDMRESDNGIELVLHGKVIIKLMSKHHVVFVICDE